MNQATQGQFRFGLGHRSLEFVATVADRPGAYHERLREPTDLSRWLKEAGDAHPSRVTPKLLDEARQLREAIHAVLRSALDGKRPPATELRLVNAWARRPVAAPQIGPGFARELAGPDAATAALAQLARASVELVTGPYLARVRACAGCSLLFLDRSRPGRRRWCSMDRCGNRVKTARYRGKQRA